MRYVHVSKPLITVVKNGQLQTIVSPARGATLNFGSKRLKRSRFAAKKAAKAQRRADKRTGLIEQRYEAHLDACRDFDAEKIAQEAA